MSTADQDTSGLSQTNAGASFAGAADKIKGGIADGLMQHAGVPQGIATAAAGLLAPADKDLPEWEKGIREAINGLDGFADAIGNAFEDQESMQWLSQFIPGEWLDKLAQIFDSGNDLNSPAPGLDATV